MVVESSDVVDRGPKDRSPSFPFIPLQTAIERLVAFEKQFGRHPTPADKTGLAWGMKPKSSQADQTLSALRSFGLITYEGAGTSRQAVITDEGRTYLRAQQDTVKLQVLKQCALRPKMIRKFWSTWGIDRPHEAVALDELTLKNGFSDSGADSFLKVYDATIAYAGLKEADKTEDVKPALDEGTPDPPPPPTDAEVGDLVQREVNGVLSFSKPERIRKIIEHESQKWFFIDGSDTGFLMSEAIVETKGSGAGASPPRLPLDEPKDGWHEERLLDESGDEVFVRYKGEPSKERYEFIRDYLDFKVKRMK